MLNIMHSAINGQFDPVPTMGMGRDHHAATGGFVTNRFDFRLREIPMLQFIRGRHDPGARTNFHQVPATRGDFTHAFSTFPGPVHNARGTTGARRP